MKKYYAVGLKKSDSDFRMRRRDGDLGEGCISLSDLLIEIESTLNVKTFEIEIENISGRIYQKPDMIFGYLPDNEWGGRGKKTMRYFGILQR